MKEQTEKQVIQYAAPQYAAKTLTELLTMAISGDKLAAAEIVSRQEAQKAEIESLKIKAASKRAPKAEKTPKEIAQDNAYYRCALLVKQFGMESITLQTLTAASAYLDQGLAQGNLRQAYNRVQQVLKAQAVTEEVFPAWIVQASSEIPTLDENKKLEDTDEAVKVERIKAIVQKYMDSETQAAEQAKNSEQPQTPAPAAAPAKKAGKK